MAEFIELTAADGFKLPAYEAQPTGTPKEEADGVALRFFATHVG